MALRPHFGKQWLKPGQEKLQKTIRTCGLFWNQEVGYWIWTALFSWLVKMIPAGRSWFILERVCSVIFKARKHFFHSLCANRLSAFFRDAGPDNISAVPFGQNFSTDETRSRRKFRAVWDRKKKKNPEMQHKAEGQGRGAGGGVDDTHLLCWPWWRPMVCHMNLRLSCSLQLPSESLRVAREDPLTVREQKTNRQTNWPYDF